MVPCDWDPNNIGLAKELTVLNQPISYGQRVSARAKQTPDQTCIVFVPQSGEPQSISWRTLENRSNQIARLLAERGIDEHSRLVLGFGNCIEHYLVAIASWKLGAMVLPLRAAMSQVERQQVLELFEPKLVVADWTDSSQQIISLADLQNAKRFSTEALADIVSHPGKAIGSGGSTGRPKIIVDPGPWAFMPGQFSLFDHVGWQQNWTQLVAGPLYHNAPFLASYWGLFESHTLVVMERFDAARCVDLIEQYRIHCGFLAPTMMQRIADLPDIQTRDFKSIESIYHTASPCPEWVKRRWIELIGAEQLYEAYGATEDIGVLSIRGDRWIEQPGSVGAGATSGVEVKILVDSGEETPVGEVGELFLRKVDGSEPGYRYLGADPLRTLAGGFTTAGDMAWRNEQGYVFLADRRVDLIITGGENVYPAEVESAISAHEEVADVVVIGIPDPQWGKRVHAVVQLHDASPQLEVEQVRDYCRQHLTAYKVPKTISFVDLLPREPSGKIRRCALVHQCMQMESISARG